MKLRLTIAALFLVLTANAQHNSSYSQYAFNALLLNPAYAGSSDALNLTSLYRRQWLGLDGSPTTITFSAHMPVKSKKISLGMSLSDEKFGVSEHTKAMLIYAYRFRLLGGKFSFGLQAGVDTYRANWNQVRTTQLRDPSFTGNVEKKIIPQAGFGLYYYTNNMYAGIAVPRIFNPGQPMYETALLHAGCVLPVSEDIKIKPSVLVNSPLDVNPILTFYWKNVLGLGVGYSMNQTAMAFLDLKINDQFRLGYAYDYTFSNLRNYSTGSHELMLRYLFHYKVNVSSSRYF